MDFNTSQLAFLAENASYIWWEKCDKAMEWPEQIVAQIMNRGMVEDVERLESLFPVAVLSRVLQESLPGQLDYFSWERWHRKLGLVGPGEPVPPTPPRQIGPDQFFPGFDHDTWDDLRREI
jgi:hypothetical protein